MDARKDPSYKRLVAIDWCASWIRNPDYHVALMKAPNSSPELGGALLGKTLATDDTIRAAVCLYKIEQAQIKETVILFDIGTGLNGLPGAAHGGIIATLLDEACGIFVASLVGAKAQDLLRNTTKENCATIWPSSGTATLYLNVTYLKFVKTPSVVAVRCRLKEQKGRKLFINGQMEDSNGEVLSKVEALFLQRQQPKI